MEIDSEMELIEALSVYFPNSSKNKLRKMLTTGRVTVDGSVVHKAKTTLKPGNVVEILEKYPPISE